MSSPLPLLQEHDHVQIEGAKKMHGTLFPPRVLTGRNLSGERGLRVVMAIDSEPLPCLATRAAVLEGGSEFEQADEVLVVVLILKNMNM